MAQAGLQLLIDCDPRELHRKRSDGRRVIDTLHEALISQNLIKDPQWALTSQSGTHAGQPTQTAEQQYRDVFDAALEHGLGVWVQVSQIARDQPTAHSDEVTNHSLAIKT